MGLCLYLTFIFRQNGPISGFAHIFEFDEKYSAGNLVTLSLVEHFERCPGPLKAKV
jgi:hypothetical protein